VRYAAVVFDLGGVVMPSPFDAFAAHERARGLREGFIRTVNATGGDHGAWARLERGELGFAEFCAAFDAECEAAGGRIDTAALMTELGTRWGPRPEMIHALRRLRAEHFKTAALTNNWVAEGRDRHPNELAALFDVVVESSTSGLRKPDPRIYLLTCERLAVAPTETIFLDDLGMNLKPARELGMTTIKVVEPDTALRELEQLVGVKLRDGDA
jgi:putative hydrolase of the HAD superfamily